MSRARRGGIGCHRGLRIKFRTLALRINACVVVHAAFSLLGTDFSICDTKRCKDNLTPLRTGLTTFLGRFLEKLLSFCIALLIQKSVYVENINCRHTAEQPQQI
jgi:hypothetical protein